MSNTQRTHRNSKPNKPRRVSAQNSGKRAPRPALAAREYAQWERSMIEFFLSEGAARVTDIAVGFYNWYSAQNSADLRAHVNAKSARDIAALKERNNALHRAKQIYGVIASEFLYTARAATAEQLLRETDTPGAREIAELLNELVPEDYK